MSRRGLLTRAAVLGTAVPAAAAAPALAAETGSDQSGDDRAGSDRTGGDGRHRSPNRREKARRALAALRTYFTAPTGTDTYSKYYPRRDDDPEFTYCWPLSQARAAAGELSYAYARPPRDVTDLVGSLGRAQEQYWLASGGTTGLPAYTAAMDSEQGPNGDVYYDDNAWVLLHETEEVLATHRRRGDLQRAKDLVDLARSGESTDPDVPNPGGIYWAQFTKGRNTVSTMPNAKGALRLYQLTRDRDYLDDAIRWTEWTRETLLSPDEGLFWDNIGEDGTYDRTFWTYNQGVPLGVEVLLYELTGRRRYRDRAIELYDDIVDHYRLFDGGGGFDDEPLQFAAVLTANLVMAEAVIGPRIQGGRIARTYADVLWNERRDAATDLYDGEKREGGDRLQLLDQAGYARALAVAAVPFPATRLLG